MEVVQFIPTLWNMGIEDGTFAYEDETLSVSDQLAKFKEDEKGCTTEFIYDIQTKLKYGNLQWSVLR